MDRPSVDRAGVDVESAPSSQAPPEPSPGIGGVAALALFAATVVAAATATVLRPLDTFDGPAVPWPVLALAFFIAEFVLVHYEHRRESHSISFSGIPLAIGLFTLQPALLIAVGVGARVIAFGAVRRQPLLKLSTNLAATGLEITTAVCVFRLLVDQLGIPSWAAAFLAVIASDLVSAFFISAAISAYTRTFAVDVGAIGAGTLEATGNVCLALLTLVLFEAEPASLLLLAALLPVVFVSYRVHARLREQHQNLAELYEFSQSISEAVLEDEVSETLLRGVRELMHAETAWLWVEGDDDSITAVRSADGRALAEQVAGDGPEGVLHSTAHAAGSPLLARAGEGSAVATALARLGVREALLAPVAQTSGRAATVVAADRTGDVRSFTEQDLTFFATLANHASASLENSRLLDRLREEAATNEYQATHDLLTGLPNRHAFQDHINAALAQHRVAGVVLIDLDRFKEINDTLGHHNGDLLLKEVGGRLRTVLREGDVVARLGGDEFGVLLTGVTSAAAAMTTARAIPNAFDRPFDVGGMTIAVDASVGLAVSPDHGTEAATLLQRADVAMYSCKANASGVEMYRPETDENSAARLMLATELRMAIETEELEVYFQPQVELKSGHPMGAEALVRWPRMQGVINPAELVSLAEHTGLIRPLTRHVLTAAARACRQWWDLGWPIRVSVNFSARTLVDEGLVDEIAAVLAGANLPPNGLCVELTETTIVAERHRVVPVLERLRGLGISIAIDDFGTGYSSLAYLARLPVDEIKIDKSFVMDMSTDSNADAIVRTILDLAVNLGLPVVAEGIETEEARATLAERGCAFGQGYFFSRPVPPSEFLEWLQRGRLTRGAPVDAPGLRAEQS